MARKSPTTSTLRALFAKSGNTCAFPNCAEVLVEEDGLYVGEVCHIEAAEPGGARYQTDSDDESRRGLQNLILLCHPHHRRVDSDPEAFPVSLLREMKANHEEANSANPFRVNPSVFAQIDEELTTYQSELKRLQEQQELPDFALDLKPNASDVEVFQGIRDNVENISRLFDIFWESVRHVEQDLAERLADLRVGPEVARALVESGWMRDIRNWDYHNLGVPNTMAYLSAWLIQAEILYRSERAKTDGDDKYNRDRLNVLKNDLVYYFGEAMLND